MDTVFARQGETLDAICQRHYGYTAGITEKVLTVNPGLADFGPVLPIGHKIILPRFQPQHTKTTIKLWD